MATLERYARVWAKYKGSELSLGLQADTEQGAALDYLLDWMEHATMTALVTYDQKSSIEDAIRRDVVRRWPNRAWFVEFDWGPDEVRRGVQVYQPYGLPRTLDCPAPESQDRIQAWATFGTWNGPGHRPGCDALPRTARGCYCGGDHQ